MTEPPLTPPGPEDRSEPEPSPADMADAAAAAQPSLGAMLAAVGFGMAAISSALAWANQPLAPVDQGLYPTAIPLPNLIRPTATGFHPNVALTLVALAVPGIMASLLRSEERTLLVLRRVLAVAIAAVVVLFAVRWNAFFGDDLPAEVSFLRSLRSGFYVAAAGSVLAFASGRWRRREAESEPGRLGVLPEDRP